MTNSSMKGLALFALLLVAPLAAGAQQKSTVPAQDKIIPEKATQLYAIGAEDGESWELLSGVRSVAFDARDNMYVLDGNNYRVLVFDATGKFVRQISKQGGGPGELQSPVSMAVAADGSIVVADIGRRGYSIFKSDGTFVKNVLFDEGFMAGGVEAHPRGGVVSRATMMFNFGRGGAPGRGAPSARGVARGGAGGAINLEGVGGPTGERKSPVMWYDLNTGKASQIHEFTLPSLTPKVMEQGGSGEQRRVMVAISPPVWQMDVYMGVLPSGGLAYVTEKDYRVHITDAAGKPERLIERPIPAKKATEKDKEQAIERRRENMRNNTGGIRVNSVNGRQSFSAGGPREIPSLEDLLKDATFEEYIPALRQIRTDATGRIWLLRTPADHGQTGPIDLIRTDGTYIGTLASGRLPDAVSRTGHAAWIERDDLGVEHVVVRRLPASWQ